MGVLLYFSDIHELPRRAYRSSPRTPGLPIENVQILSIPSIKSLEGQKDKHRQSWKGKT